MIILTWIHIRIDGSSEQAIVNASINSISSPNQTRFVLSCFLTEYCIRSTRDTITSEQVRNIFTYYKTRLHKRSTGGWEMTVPIHDPLLSNPQSTTYASKSINCSVLRNVSELPREIIESNDGFNTRVWGPALWHVLHAISFGYPATPTTRTRGRYMQFIQGLGNVLPCRSCRDNYQSNLANVGFGDVNTALITRRTFVNFVYRLHREVSKMKNTNMTFTCKDLDGTFQGFQSSCGSTKCDDVRSCTMRVVPVETQIATFNVSSRLVQCKQCDKRTRRLRIITDAEINISILTWSSPLWHILHTISFNYPLDPSVLDKKHYCKVLTSLCHVLPNKHARDVYKNALRVTGFRNPQQRGHIIKHRQNFSVFVFDLARVFTRAVHIDPFHSFQTLKTKYEQFRAQCTPPTKETHGGCEKTANPSRCVLSF